ncbi:MAG: HAD-IC family P-type ATPase [Bacillota bacterium]|nr:HAD-IC family P-type ATPase [Bacillota bacterium]
MPGDGAASAEETGLDSSEAARRLRQFGPNEVAHDRRRSGWRRLVEALKEPMFFLLLLTASVYFILGDTREGLTMLLFVVAVVAITVAQEWRTERALDALRDLAAPRAHVLRDGAWTWIPARDVVPGDFIAVVEGERVPADIRLRVATDLRTDESMLTGESEPVWKSAGDACYGGTSVLQGQGWGVVTATGAQSQLGQIGQLLASVEEHPTPLQSQIRALVRQFFLVGAALSVTVGGLVAWEAFRSGSGKPWTEAVLAGISLAMAMIPEEFPVVLTVFLSLGAWRLSRQDALVRRLPSVETLGSIRVLCVDKTGTLTENRMTVRDAVAWDPERPGQAAEEGSPAGPEAWAELVRAAVLACEEEPYDPMDLAIERWSAAEGAPAGEVRAGRRLVHEYPFRPEDKWMGHVWQGRNGEFELAVKGAPETVLPLCELSERERAAAEGVVHRLASRGLRVLAVGKGSPHDPGLRPPFPERLADHRLRLVGLLGLADPPREGVREAVALCREAGVDVVMITGDHPATAEAIAREVGIDGNGGIVTGEQLDQLSDTELDELVASPRAGAARVFARAVPAHKLRLVRAWRRRGRVVAMTGDGVNDAPALKEADIGIAMGKRGTDVARDAADMVLLDDNFVTIAKALRQGRRIYDNIRKAVAYILTIHLPIAGLALLAPLLGLPLFLWPIHIALLELVLDPTCSVVFEATPEEPDLMRRPPRSPEASLVDRGLLAQALALGATLLGATLMLYQAALSRGLPEPAARSLGLVTLLLGNVLLVLSMSSESESLWSSWRRAINGNPAASRSRWALAAGTLLILLTILYIPGFRSAMGTAPISAGAFLLASAVAALATLWWEGVKGLRRRRR